MEESGRLHTNRAVGLLSGLGLQVTSLKQRTPLTAAQAVQGEPRCGERREQSSLAPSPGTRTLMSLGGLPGVSFLTFQTGI